MNLKYSLYCSYYINIRIIINIFESLYILQQQINYKITKSWRGIKNFIIKTYSGNRGDHANGN